MSSENAPKEIVQLFIDLVIMTKRLMNENQQPTSLIMFHFYFFQSTIHLIHFIVHIVHISLIGYIYITWSFNHIVSFTFQPIPSLEINDLRVSLDKFLILGIHYLRLNCGDFATVCLFILNKKCNTQYRRWREER